MTNTAPIDTQTKVIRIDLTGDVETQIRAECDRMGALGYELRAAFVQGGNLVLIFQLTR